MWLRESVRERAEAGKVLKLLVKTSSRYYFIGTFSPSPTKPILNDELWRLLGYDLLFYSGLLV